MTTNHTPRERQEAAMSETTEAPRGAWVWSYDVGSWLLHLAPPATLRDRYVGRVNAHGWRAFLSPTGGPAFAAGSEPFAHALVERALFARGVRYARFDGQPWPEEAPSPEPAPVTREELDALASRVAALEATTAATPEPASAATRERTREDVATAPVVGDVVRRKRRVWAVTAAGVGLVCTDATNWTDDQWAELVHSPATDVLPMRRPE